MYHFTFFYFANGDVPNNHQIVQIMKGHVAIKEIEETIDL
jgi:hypothetical protein